MHREADVVYRYDGSFEGFLCCVFHSFETRQLPFDILTFQEPATTLFPEQHISTDSAKARRVSVSLPKKLGPKARRVVATAFLSGRPQKDLLLLRFLVFAYSTGPAAFSMAGHALVAPVLAMEQEVSHEAHLFTGFVRFQDYGEFLGATIAPKHAVLPLLRRHFCQRFPSESFLIYDQTHCAVLLHQPDRTEYAVLEQPPVFPSPSQQELAWQSMWKEFYRAIAIPQRQNHTLRRSHCPKRFWSNMTELAPEL